MDLFGTVVGAIDLVSKLVDYLQAVKGAKEDRQRLLSEVSALGALLEVLRGRLDNLSSDDSISGKLVKAGINRPLHMCLEALKSIVRNLERLVSDANIKPSSLLAEKMKNLRWPFRQEDIRAALSNIERLKTLVSLALQSSLMEFIEKARDELAIVGLNVEGIKSAVSSLEADQRAHTKQIESIQGDFIDLGVRLQGATNDIAAIRNAVARTQKGQENRDILHWISAPDFDQKHSNAFGKHANGTGEWFLREPKFVAWRLGWWNMLWCPGNPGVGKSVMTSVIIHNLQEGMTEDEAVVFAYFDYTTTHTTQELVGALLSQLVRRGMSNSGIKSLQKRMKGTRPTLEDLWDIFEAEVETYDRVFVVIDALDEAAGPIWIPLLRRLRTLPRIGILATSRDLGNIAVEFQDDHRLDIMSDKEDLRKYIEERILGSTGSFEWMLKRDPSLRAEIITGVVEKADGMFLLAWLHMNALETESRVLGLRRTLGQLPGDLKSAYDATIDRISDQDKELALHIFSWVIHAARPMRIDDLRYALAVEDGMTVIDPDFLYDRAHITSVCVGLVTLRPETSHPHGAYVGLVHYTTRDHLCEHLSAQLPHPAHLAITSLRYIAFETFNRPLDLGALGELINTPLAWYAIKHWGDHARMHGNDPTAHRLAMELLRDDQRVVALGSNSLASNIEGVTATQLCAYFGLPDYLTCLLDHGSDVNSKDPNGGTALAVAARSGREEILQLLLAREGINVNLANNEGVTPLRWAVLCQHHRIVELLLARDDVNVNLADSNGTTPLISAIVTQNQRMVQLLLARDDVDVNSHNSGWMTPMAHAIVNGHSGIVGLLLARSDLDINWQDKDGCSPLALAIIEGREAIVQLLLASEDLKFDSTDNRGNTYLSVAAGRNSDRIAKLLLAKGIDVNSRNLHGQTALSVATWLGHDAVVKVLLAQDDIEINVVDSYGKTPLDRANSAVNLVNLGFPWGDIEKHRSVAELLRAAGCRTSAEVGTGLGS